MKKTILNCWRIKKKRKKEKDPFKNCINLKNIVIPDFYKTYEDYLFRNCRQLVLKYLSGQEKDFRTRSS